MQNELTIFSIFADSSPLNPLPILNTKRDVNYNRFTFQYFLQTFYSLLNQNPQYENAQLEELLSEKYKLEWCQLDSFLKLNKASLNSLKRLNCLYNAQKFFKNELGNVYEYNMSLRDIHNLLLNQPYCIQEDIFITSVLNMDPAFVNKIFYLFGTTFDKLKNIPIEKAEAGLIWKNLYSRPFPDLFTLRDEAKWRKKIQENLEEYKRVSQSRNRPQ